jgi:hypothetical protein
MAKAKKSNKAKAKKARKSAAKPAKKAKRVSARAGTPVTAPMHSVVQFVKMLIDQGQADIFENNAREAEAVVTFDDHAAAFVTKFLAENRHLRRPMALAVHDPCPGNPFEC